jgi:hypothetical protein
MSTDTALRIASPQPVSVDVVEGQPCRRLAEVEGTATVAPLLLRLRDAARVLSIGERLLWAMTAPRGPIPCVRLGRAVRYSVVELQRWIHAQ